MPSRTSPACGAFPSQECGPLAELAVAIRSRLKNPVPNGSFAQFDARSRVLSEQHESADITDRPGPFVRSQDRDLQGLEGWVSALRSLLYHA